MPTTLDELKTAGQTANKAQSTANAATSAGSTIETELNDALRGVVANEGAVKERASAQSKWLESGSAARNMYANPDSAGYIFNPYQREALIGQYRQNAYTPYAALTDYLGMRAGSIPQIAASAANTYNASIQPQLLAAQNAQNDYGNLLQQYQLEQQAAAAEAAKQQQEFENQLKLQQLALSQQGSSGGSNLLGQYLQSGGEITPEFLKAGILSGQLSAADANALAGFSGIGDKPNEKATAYDNALRQVNEALGLLNKDSGVAGWNPLYSLQTSGIGQYIPGKANQNRVNFERALADLAGGQAFGEAGKALTDTEKALIQGKIPERGKSADFLKSQLESIGREIESRRAALDNANGNGPDQLWNLVSGY